MLYLSLLTLLCLSLPTRARDTNWTLLTCVQGIARFSSRLSPQHYYECAEDDTHPRLLECKEDLVYVTHKKRCMDKSAAGPGPLNDKGLGRNLQLGSMFDGRENQYFSDASFWTQNTIKDEAFKYNRKEVKTEYSDSKRVRQKISSWSVDAHFSLDLLGGLISIKGSAAYARETIDTDTEVNVQMTYHTTKYTKTLPKKTPIDWNEECNSDKYTHVVTSVTYGMDAVFVFKRVVHEHEFEGKISGSLGWILQAIPGLSTGHSYSFDEEITSILDTSSLTMYGDFAPDEPLPATLEQAVEFYKKLPSLYGNGTILDVHLTPISEFCSGVDVKLNQISNDLIAKSSDVLDELEQLGMKVRGLLKRDPTLRFKPLEQNLKIYKDAFDIFESGMKSNLTKILPNIRGGTGNGEDDLVEWINKYLNSTFQFDISSEFLVDRTREIQSIGFLIESFEQFPNIVFADYESANDVEFIFSHDYVMIMEFNILNNQDISNNFLEGTPVNETDLWYNKVGDNGFFGAALRNFHEFALENVNIADRGFIVRLSPYKEEKMVLNAYIKGELFSDKFEIPLTPRKIVPFDISTTTFKAEIPRYNEFTQGCKYFLHDLKGDNIFENEQMFSPEGSQEEVITIEVTGLSPLTQYTFTVQYMTEMGKTPTSLPVQPFLSTGTSEPQNLVLEEVDYHSFKVSWKKPAVIAKELIGQIKYRISVFGDDDKDATFAKEIVTTELEAVIDGLVNAAKYSVSVTAFVADYEVTRDKHVPVESLPILLSVFSSPLSPTMLDTGEINIESLTLRWSPPTETAQGSEIQQFSIEYAAMNQNATETIEGSANQLYTNTNEVFITDLLPGSLYAFKSKIYTTEGVSDISMDMILRTQFNQTELDQMKDDIKGNMDDVADEMEKRSRFCGFSSKSNVHGEIQFDSFFTSDNNVAGAEMSGGSFTAGASGIYKVIVNTEITTGTEEQHWVWVMVNGVKMEESMIHTSYSIYATGKGSDIGSRMLLVQMNATDTISLAHEADKDKGYLSASLCVSSVAFQ